MQGLDELRARVEHELETLDLTAELGDLVEPMRYALAGGGKRIRPTLCLATAEAAGGSVEDALGAALALELIHTFSLVHDDLPAMDDDDVRRGRPSTHVAFGDGVALLAGDALLAEAIRLAITSPGVGVADELLASTQGMIGGQYLDISDGAIELAEVHALKTGRLFTASVGLGLRTAGIGEHAQTPWRRFGEEVGALFQVVDDVIDGDGYAETLGPDGARSLAAEIAERARARLDGIPADTHVLREIVDELAVRTA
jgi:geranylgeranyl diphosphate synthase type II